MLTHIRTHVFINTHFHTCIHKHTCSLSHTHTHTHTHVFINKHAHTHTHTHTCIHKHMLIHTYAQYKVKVKVTFICLQLITWAIKDWCIKYAKHKTSFLNISSKVSINLHLSEIFPLFHISTSVEFCIIISVFIFTIIAWSDPMSRVQLS